MEQAEISRLFGHIVHAKTFCRRVRHVCRLVCKQAADTTLFHGLDAALSRDRVHASGQVE